MSSQIDNLIAERRGIRRELAGRAKLDPVGDVEVGAVGLPPRGSSRGPRVVSDVQLVPPRPVDVTMETASMDDSSQPVGGSAKRARKRDRRRVKMHDVRESRLLPQIHLSGGRGSSLLTGVDVSAGPVDMDVQSLGMSRERRGVMAARNKCGVTAARDNGRPAGSSSGPQAVKSVVARPINRRVPKSAAVCIKRNTDGPSYAQMLRKAREQIQLGGIGIEDTRIRWAANGSVLIEVAGNNMGEKTDLFASKLREVLEGEATISRPVARGEMRIWGLDDSVSTDEVACVIADAGGCLPIDITVGAINRIPNGLGSVWIRCLLAAAVKAASSGRIRIGWSTVRIELLSAKPVQCYKCWQYGHVRNACRANIDRAFACFRCGQTGHRARDCTEAAYCVVCAQLGNNANHRMGSNNCGAVVTKDSRRKMSMVSDRRTGDDFNSINVL